MYVVCRGSVRLYSDFYESDIIVASPLALATKLSEDAEEGTLHQRLFVCLLSHRTPVTSGFKKWLQKMRPVCFCIACMLARMHAHGCSTCEGVASVVAVHALCQSGIVSAMIAHFHKVQSRPELHCMTKDCHSTPEVWLVSLRCVVKVWLVGVPDCDHVAAVQEVLLTSCPPLRFFW